jgi:DNA gyrase subunit A
MGVKAIELDEDDAVVALAITDPERQQVLAVCERGYGKRTALSEFRQQKRGGKGIILIDTSERNGPVVGLALVRDNDEVMLVTDRGQMIRTRVAEIRETGRNAQGVRVMNVDADERVVAIEQVGESDDEEVNATALAEGKDAANVGEGSESREDVQALGEDAGDSEASDGDLSEGSVGEGSVGDDEASEDDDAPNTGDEEPGEDA